MSLVLSTVVDCSAVVVLVHIGPGAQEWFGGATIVERGWTGWKASALPASRSEVAARVDGNVMIVDNCVT